MAFDRTYRVVAKRKEMIEAIRAALDCYTHFHKPTIINNDKDFSIGNNALVICDQCVERLRKVIGLQPNEKVPPGFQFGCSGFKTTKETLL